MWGVEPIAQNGIFYQPIINSESTLLSRTLKVRENKVPSEFPICQSKAEYLAIFDYPTLYISFPTYEPSNPQYAQNNIFYQPNINSESILLSQTLKV